ncbi:MAG: Fic family protein [Candidatus Woesearchaeota archaeon]
MYTDKQLLEEIASKRKTLSQRPVLEAMLTGRFDTRNYRESLQHSARIAESAMEQLKDLSPKEQQKYVEENLGKTLADLTRAWNYGVDHYRFPFDENCVLEVASRVEPEIFNDSKADYRRLTLGVRPGRDASVTPPYPAKIPHEMKKFFENMNSLQEQWAKESSESILDISSWVHLHMVRIHPFEDGNGRTARLMSNLMLVKNNYPPLFIAEGERKTYNKLLDRAVVGFKNRESGLVYEREQISEEEKILYDYFAGKINSAFDEMF